MNAINLKKLLIIGFISSFLLLNFSRAFAIQEAGRVVFSFGQGSIKGADNKIRPLKRGAKLLSGDEIITKNRARAQIKLKDGSFFSLKPKTQFKIENFVFTKKESENKSFFGLVRGGFRALTGLIGQRSKSAYRVNTPVATIGIRGTDYDVILTSPLNGSKGSLVTHTNSGAISLTNQGGTQVFGAGQSGFVADNKSAPRQATKTEASKIAQSTGKKKAKEKKENNTEKKQKVKKDKKEDPTKKTSNNADKNKKQGVAGGSGETVSFTDASSTAATGSFIFNPRVTSISGAALKDGSDTGVSRSLPTGKVTTDKTGKVSQIFFTETSGIQVESVNIANVTNFGNNGATGLSWGRWVSTDTGINPDGSVYTATNNIANAIHWVTGPKVTLPSTGSASYKVIGNTAPTSGGATGVLGNVNLNVDFVQKNINQLSVSASVGSNTWSATQSNVAFNNAGTFNATALTDTANATTNTLNQTGSNISGNFTGFGASGAAMTYHLKSGNGVVTGAVALSKQ